MSLADDVARARAVDAALAALGVLVEVRGGTEADDAFGVVRAELSRLTVDNGRLRDVLGDIARAEPSACDQTPYWARDALDGRDT